MEKKPLIVACGLSGSGKTYNARYLAKELDSYAYVNPELVRQELGITVYARKDTPKVLARMVEDIEALSAEGKGVIVDANLKANDTRQVFYDTANNLGLGLLIIEFFCSERLHKERIAGRHDLASGMNHPKDPSVYDRQKPFWQDIGLDFLLPENAHVAWISFNTETYEGIRERVPEESVELVDRILGLLVKKEQV